MAAHLSCFLQGALSEAKKLRALHGGVLRDAKTLKAMDGDELRLVASFIQPLAVSATNTSNNPSFGPTTRASVASVSGGLAPYAYAWAILTGDATINSPNSSSTTFTKPDFIGGDQITARVTVTDAQGSSAQATMTATWRTGGTD